jgi:hypothetical protein
VATTSGKSPVAEEDYDRTESAPPKKPGFAGLEVAGGEEDDDQDNLMVCVYCGL